jgi:acetoin utilization deacetylase AcuC-like enzyme
VDIDVHHGNGTQSAFQGDPRVLFISTHQYDYGFYPGTGHWRDRGIGAGGGCCLNISLPPHTGDMGYRQAFEMLVEPALRRFRPDLIMVSAGYDAHWAESLFHTAMLLSLAGYRHMMDSLVRLACELAGGRMVVALEGGYDQRVLAHGVADAFGAMLGLPPGEDPLGPAPRQEVPVAALLEAIARWHGLA